MLYARVTKPKSYVMTLLINMGIQELIVLFLIAGFIILPIFAILDIMRSDFKESNNKIIWVLIVLLFPIFGSIIYFAIGASQKVLEKK